MSLIAVVHALFFVGEACQGFIFGQNMEERVIQVHDCFILCSYVVTLLMLRHFTHVIDDVKHVCTVHI